MTQPAADLDARSLVLTRVLDAPRELVFAAFTDPDQVGRWYGPRGFTVTTHASDLRVGGEWRYTMHGPDGTDYPNRHLYREIAPPARLAYLHDSGVDGDPHGFEVLVTFDDLGDRRTRLTMRSVFATVEAVAHVRGFGAEELGYQTLDKLAEFLAARR